jgi:hypothetical protein
MRCLSLCMSGPKGSAPKTPQSSKELEQGDGVSDKSSGRVTFDSRGNSVWEWKSEETGKYSRDVSTQRLKKLEAPELSIEETARVKKLDGLSLQDEPLPGGGFNPYDNAPAKNNTKMPTRGHVAPDKVAPTPERKTPTDLRALGRWIEMKKRLDERKDDKDDD